MELLLAIVAVVFGAIGVYFGYRAKQSVDALEVVVRNNHIYVNDSVAKLRSNLIQEIVKIASDDSEFRKDVENHMYGGTE